MLLRGGFRLLLAVGFALVLEQLVFAATGATLPGLDDLRVRDWWWSGVLLLFTVIAVERARAVRRERLPWTLVAVAMALWSLGELYWVVELAPLGDDAPYPSWADALWIAFYVPLLAAVVLLARARIGGVPRILGLDAAIVAFSIAAIAAAVVVQTVVDAGAGAPTSAIATNLAYPVADLLLLSLTGAVIAVNGWRIGRASLPLVAGLALFTLSDSAYAYTVAAGTYDVGGLIDVGWVLAFAALAFGAWQTPALTATVRMPHRRAAIAPAAFGALMVAILVAAQAVDVGTLAVCLAAAALAALVARMAAAVIALDRANARLEEARRIAEQQSRIDPLTGLFNRRHLAERVGDELHAARAGERLGAVALALVDVDHFKLVNDRHGHPAGDRVLAEIAVRIESAVGEHDVVGRWGGEEFCALLVGVESTDDLRARCDAIRAAVSARPIPLDAEASVVVTCSVGAAVGLLRLEDAMHRADRALYAAKQSGRNRTVLDGDAYAAAVDEPEELRLARTMAIAASLREDASSLHWQQVAELAAAVARRMDLSPQTVARCELGGLVHDIGKVGLPEGLLLKRGPLDPNEWSLMRAHSEVGEQMAREACVLEAVAEIVRHHHERFDGSGYPDGLTGHAIPVEARIVAACDAYSAMTTERAYQRARSQDDAIEELRRCAGSHLDPVVVDALIAELGERHAAAARHFGTWAA